MSHNRFAGYLLGLTLGLGSLAAHAQQPAAKEQPAEPSAQMHIPYGVAVGLEDAKKMAAAAVAEAGKANWTMCIAVTDTAGDLVYFEKMDGAETSAVRMAIEKAKSSVLFRRPTKAFQDALAKGGDNLRILGMQGAVPVGGGIPLVRDGKMIGAIGVSGGTGAQDDRTAAAGVAALPGAATGH